MTLLVYLFFLMVFYSNVWISIKSEKLAIDPMSIFLDPNLYRFCWIQLIPSGISTIVGWEKGSKISIFFEVFPDKQLTDKTFCIEHKSLQGYYIIPLEMTSHTDTPKIINFTISFYQPLGPPLELIRIQSTLQRIHFEMDTEFVGISKETDPRCNILIMSEAQKKINFQIARIIMPRKLTIVVQPNSIYSVYYTCDLRNFVMSSTRFIVIKDNLINEQNTVDLEPLIQMPLRRFLKVVWKHPGNSQIRYDVAISEKNSDQTYTCVKIFRIFVNMVSKIKINLKTYVTYCKKDIAIEDLGHFSSDGNGWISTILDMVTLLKMYRKYKLDIVWIEKSENIKSNFIHFTPFSSENYGKINNIFFEYYIRNNKDIVDEISSISQKALSKNNVNPYNYTSIKMPGYNKYKIFSSIMLSSTIFKDVNGEVAVTSLYDDYRNSDYNKGFFPYFYALFELSNTKDKNTDIEIVQLQIPQVKGNGITNLKFIPNNEIKCFIISFKIQNHPYVTTPSMFAVKINFADNSTCYGVYLLKCRTCNTIYIKSTMDSASKVLNNWKTTCFAFKEVEGHYDAIDSGIFIKTEKMPANVKLVANIFAFRFDVVDESESSEYHIITEDITASLWREYGNLIIAVISATVTVTLLAGLFLFCKRLCRNPEVIEKSPKKLNSFDEELYDDDLM